MDEKKYYDIYHEFMHDVFIKFESDFLNVLVDHFGEELYIYDENEDEPIEILEVYAISKRLAELLKACDEKCVNYYGLSIWCRTCSGQAIWLDSVFEEIYDALIEEREAQT